MQPPVRQMLVHERREAVVMMPLNEMHEFVDDDGFEAVDRLFGEFEVQPNVAGHRVACAPPIIGGRRPELIVVHTRPRA